MLSEEALISGYTTPPLTAPAPAAASPSSSSSNQSASSSSAASPMLPMPLPAPVSIAMPVSSATVVSRSSAEAPLSTAEACMYLFLGVSLNFLGLLISILVKRGLTPCMMGFAFSWALYDALITLRIGSPVGLFALTIVFLIITYYRFHSERQGKEGNTADFVFYLVLSIPFSFAGLFFGFFQDRRKGMFGSSLGFVISLCLTSLSFIVVGAVTKFWAMMAVAILFLIVFLALLALVVIKILRGWDASSMPFLTFLLISAAFGPFGILAAVLNPETDAAFGGIFGIFVWSAFVGLYMTVSNAFGLLSAGIVLMIGSGILMGLLHWVRTARNKEPPQPSQTWMIATSSHTL